jgi:hypothetical protein
MPAGFVLAIMLCSGDNCEMVRAEPGVSYPTYEACAAASASRSKSAMLSDLAARYQAEKRQADIICLRESGAELPPAAWLSLTLCGSCREQNALT